MPQTNKMTTKARMPPKVRPKKPIKKSDAKLHATARKSEFAVFAVAIDIALRSQLPIAHANEFADSAI